MYIVVFEPYISYEREKKGVSEFVAKTVKEPKAFVHAKTIDYIENAMMANFSKVSMPLCRKREDTKESKH